MSYSKGNRYVELVDELGICGCGNPEIAYRAVHEMLKNAAEKNVLRILKNSSDDVDPFELFAAYILNRDGYLDHGSSVYGSWLTDKGKDLLEALNIMEKFEYEYQDFYEDNLVLVKED